MDTRKIGYDTEEIKMSKKANMMYWDNIDWTTEEYIKKLLMYSMPTVILEHEDDEILEMGKEVTGFVVKMLEERCGAHFPYVDENY